LLEARALWRFSSKLGLDKSTRVDIIVIAMMRSSAQGGKMLLTLWPFVGEDPVVNLVGAMLDLASRDAHSNTPELKEEATAFLTSSFVRQLAYQLFDTDLTRALLAREVAPCDEGNYTVPRRMIKKARMQ
jgi:hypothetical protein